MVYHTQEWYTPAEIATHNHLKDCWVTLNGKVLDLTEWVNQQMLACQCIGKKCNCQKRANKQCCDTCVEKCPCFNKGYLFCDHRRLPVAVLAFAGKDISHWFNGDEFIFYTHPITGTRTPYYRFGPPEKMPVVPSTLWRPVPYVPWWLDPKYVIGKLTAKTRPITIINTLTEESVTIEVCSEETIYQIMLRYLPYNAHMMSYTWRYRERGLCLNKSLEENGIPDEREMFVSLGLPENNHVPAILVYYNDDLTEDPPSGICYCDHVDCQLKRREKCFATRESHFKRQ